MNTYNPDVHFKQTRMIRGKIRVTTQRLANKPFKFRLGAVIACDTRPGKTWGKLSC